MSIKEINNNGKSKIIAHHTGVLQSPKNGHTGSKANVSAPSHSSKPLVNLGHSTHPNTAMQKVLKDQGTGGAGMKGSF